MLRIKSANMVRVVGYELPWSRDARIPVSLMLDVINVRQAVIILSEFT